MTNDKTALGALAFFVPSAPFDALILVAELSRNALEASLDRLDALSLVDKLESADRYALHPLTRAFARDELLADANVAHETGMRFAKYWVDYAERYGHTYYRFYYRLEDELKNLDSAMSWLWDDLALPANNLSNKEHSRMLCRLGRSLRLYLSLFGHWDEETRYQSWAYEASLVLKNKTKAGWCAYYVALNCFYTYQTDEASA